MGRPSGSKDGNDLTNCKFFCKKDQHCPQYETMKSAFNVADS